jgi:hypothetical protein
MTNINLAMDCYFIIVDKVRAREDIKRDVCVEEDVFPKPPSPSFLSFFVDEFARSLIVHFFFFGAGRLTL